MYYVSVLTKLFIQKKSKERKGSGVTYHKWMKRRSSQDLKVANENQKNNNNQKMTN
jgi:hypothetical protein